MFLTDNAARHPFASQLYGDGMTVWRAATLATLDEWFYLNCLVKSPEGEFPEIILISHPSHDLLSFLDQRKDDVTVIDVQLVSPPHLNGTRRWKMEPLVRIWRDPSNSWSHRYEVANGNRYHSIQNDRDNTEFELCREFTLSDAAESAPA